MKVSIITVNLNNLRGLRKTMESVLAQDSSLYEWIVIDGGSTDGSRELIEQNQDKIAYWVSEPDKGIYHAMNKGIAHATGDYLLFLNSGDCLVSSDIVHFFTNCENNADFIVCENKEKTDISIDKEMERLCVSAFPHQSTFIKRCVFDEYGLYREDKRLASDWWFVICALIKGHANVAYLPIRIVDIEPDGLSQRLHDNLFQERNELLKENKYLFLLMNFYANNRMIIQSLHHNSFVFFIFRIYFWIYRKFLKKQPC